MRLTAYGVLIAALYATGCCGSTSAPIVEAGDPAPEAGVCGNNRIEPPEACDDGNTTPADGCSG